MSLTVQDKTKAVINIGLYNQVDRDMRQAEVQEKFPKGTRIGIKNPYLKINMNGFLSLRNDNP